MIHNDCARGPVDGPRGHDGRRAHCLAVLASAATLSRLAAASIVLAVVPALALATPHWSSRFAVPGVAGMSAAMLEWRGQCVVLGRFDAVDDQRAEGAAVWTGTRWTSLSATLRPVHRDARAEISLTTGVVWRDHLVVAGSFDATTPAGDTLRNIAMTDGTTWSAFPSPSAFPLGTIRTMAVFQDRLFIAGDLSDDAYLRNDVAEWDPAAARWIVSPAPVTDEYFSASRLLPTADSLFLAGQFFGAGPNDEFFRVFDGMSWVPAAPPAAGMRLDVPGAVAIWQGSLVRFDTRRRYDETSGGVLRRWTGTAWDSLGGYDGAVHALAVWGGSLYGIGQRGAVSDTLPWAPPPPTLVRWTRDAFVDVATMPASATHIFGVRDGHAVIALYDYDDPAAPLGTIVEIESDRARVASSDTTLAGLRGAVAGAAVVGEALWCGTGGVRDDNAAPIAAWDGTAWSQPGGQPFVQPSDTYSARAPWVFTAAEGLLGWALYFSGPVTEFDGAALVEYRGLAGNGIHALTRYRHTWVAGGSLSGFSGGNTGDVAWWSGGAWLPLGAATLSVDALRTYNGDLYAGCRLGPSALMRWTGSAWEGIGAVYSHGTPRTVAALGEWRGQLVLGGTFEFAGEFAGDVASSNVALWDGARMTACGAGVDGPVTAVGVYHGDLVVAGAFTHAGGVPATGIARYDGAAWHAFGDGLDEGTVRALVSWRDRLIAVGEFGRAGGAPSSNIAMWEGETGPSDDTPRRATLEFADPQSAVAGGAQSVAFYLGARAPVRAMVADARGRRVAQLLDAIVDEGRHTLSWPARDAAGQRVAAGVYWLRLDTADAHIARKCVVLR